MIGADLGSSQVYGGGEIFCTGDMPVDGLLVQRDDRPIAGERQRLDNEGIETTFGYWSGQLLR